MHAYVGICVVCGHDRFNVNLYSYTRIHSQFQPSADYHSLTHRLVTELPRCTVAAVCVRVRGIKGLNGGY